MADTFEKFKVKKITKVSDIVEGKEKELPVSDLVIQENGHIVQYELVTEKQSNRKKWIIKPGIFNIVPTQMGTILEEIKIKQPNLLETVDNTKNILNEVAFFFSKLEVYEKLELEKRRAMLLYGAPGTGKTSSIARVCNKLIEEDKGTVIINWNSAGVQSEVILDFFSSESEFSKEATRMILIIEDIGSSHEGHYGPRSVDRSLLNFLDGIGVTFSVPTFIMATTNYAENLPQNLADRPGRFDRMIEIPPPSGEERVQLLKFIAKRDLDAEETRLIASKTCEKFSVAHLKEVVVRSLLNDKTIPQVVTEMINHSKRFNRGFEKGGELGL